jgi:hypothetical protein
MERGLDWDQIESSKEKILHLEQKKTEPLNQKIGYSYAIVIIEMFIGL